MEPTRPPIRTFRRRGRMSAAKLDALATLEPRYGLTVDGPFDAAAVFGRRAPLVLEIGYGMGDALLAHARAHPEHDVIGVEVHRPGTAAVLQAVEAEGLTNVRVSRDDALELLDHLVPGSLAAVHVFFPDPWPKKRHHERRLLRPDVVARLADLLEPGGVLHVATDIAHYADQMRGVLAGEHGLEPAVEDRAGRVETKYERLGRAAGRPIVDLRARRR